MITDTPHDAPQCSTANQTYASALRFSSTSCLAHSPALVLVAPAMDRQMRRRLDSASHSAVLYGRVMDTLHRDSTQLPHTSMVGVGGGSKRCCERCRCTKAVFS